MAEEDPRAFVTPPGDGQTVKNPVGGPLTFKARGEQTGRALTVFESTAAPHTWQNTGDDAARFLALFAPAAAGMERFFEHSAELADETRLPMPSRSLRATQAWKLSARRWPSLSPSSAHSPAGIASDAVA
jgi:hypothetical protein